MADKKVKKMNYEIKRKHLYMLSEILDEMNFKIDLNNIPEKANQNAVGANAVLDFLKGLYKVSDKADKLLSDITAIPYEEIEDMSAIKYMTLWKNLFDNKEFKEFFLDVGLSMNQKI